MVKIILKESCCGCSLRIGAFVVSYLHLVFGLTIFLAYLIMLQNVRISDDCVLLLFISAIGIITSLFSIYGIKEEKHMWMTPLLLYIILTVFGTFALFLNLNTSMGSHFQVGLFLACIVLLGWLLYMLILLYSHFEELRQKFLNPAVRFSELTS